ncbi:MAG: amino acid ABC transporter substrate-binding protein [Xanthobacteraceae bacterium]|nr:amino acid ABC transporter substrate-binding protein [Xanthobacteraceae bacterium]
MIRFLVALLLAVSPATAAERLVIGYVDRMDDPRHEDHVGFGGVLLEQRGRPFDGAKLAVDDLEAVGRSLGIAFELVEARAGNSEGVAGEVQKLRKERGARLILVDAPADALIAAARVMPDGLLLNVSADSDALRGVNCHAQTLHLIPSLAMHADALVQFIVARKWRDILVLEGPDARDAEAVRALERSAQRFGARIVARRPFVLGSDPREREQNNLALLTGGVAYDTIFIADESREVARFLPYQTLSPRPVIGAAGLTAAAWHWAWDRDGGANLSRRFKRMAQRPMRGEDWAAWIGAKAIIEAVLRVRTADFSKVAAYLKNAEFRVDGSKGQALTFRPWDNQLRQPVQLATADAVIAQAPFAQFLHQTENLDTLGFDRPESPCRMGGSR